MAVAIKKKGEFSENGKCLTKTGAAVLVANFPGGGVLGGWGGKWHETEVSIQGLKESNSPRLRCSVSSAIVLVIVNPRHLPGGISHSSNKFHKTNHRALHWWLPLIQFHAHARASECFTSAAKGYLEECRHTRLFIYFFSACLGSLRSEEEGEEKEDGRWRVKGRLEGIRAERDFSASQAYDMISNYPQSARVTQTAD